MIIIINLFRLPVAWEKNGHHFTFNSKISYIFVVYQPQISYDFINRHLFSLSWGNVLVRVGNCCSLISYVQMTNCYVKWCIVSSIVDAVYIYLKTFSFNNDMQVNLCELVIINTEKRGDKEFQCKKKTK